MDYVVLVFSAATSFRQRVACTEDPFPELGSTQLCC
jgi:hypothetical protein